MLPAVAGLNPYQNSLLAYAGAQQQTIATILSQALGNTEAFRSLELVQRLSTAIQKIPLPHLTSFLSAFRSLIYDCNLAKDTVTFIVLTDSFPIPRAIAIAFIQAPALARDLSQTRPIVLLKPDDASPPFSARVLKIVLSFLQTQRLDDGDQKTAIQKNVIRAADFYGIPTLRLAIHQTIKIENGDAFLDWLKFSYSINFQDKTPNRDLRSRLQTNEDTYVSEDLIERNRSEDNIVYADQNTLNIWFRFKNNEKKSNGPKDDLNPFQYSLDRGQKSIDLCGPRPGDHIFRGGTEGQRIQEHIHLIAGVIRRGMIPRLKMDLLREEEVGALLSEISEAKEKERCLLTKLEFFQVGLKSGTVAILQKFLAQHPSVRKITLVDSCAWSLNHPSFPHLTSLKITESSADETPSEFMTAFCSTSSPVLRKFSLKGKIEEASFPSILHALRTVTSLHTLKIAVDLRDQEDTDKKCKLSKETAEHITTSLSQHTQLTRLSLACGQVASGALTTLSQRIRSLSSLRTLELWYNKFDSTSLSKIVDMIPTLPPIRILKLDLNNIQGVAPIAQMLVKPCSLTSLDLSHNRLGNEGATQLSEALKTNTSLRDLNLGLNGIEREGMQVLAAIMGVNSSLKTFSLGGRNSRSITDYDDQAKKSMGHEPNLFDEQIAITFAQRLNQNLSLTSLELPGSCNLRGAQVFATTLTTQTTLETLKVCFRQEKEEQAHNPFINNPRFKVVINNKINGDTTIFIQKPA